MLKKLIFTLILLTVPLLILQNLYLASQVPAISWQHHTVQTKQTLNKTNNQTKKFKYILFWSDKLRFHWFNGGQKPLLVNKCEINTCVFTSNRSLFGGDLNKFDAIMFSGNYYDMQPKRRYLHQKYVYINEESAETHPMCGRRFNGFFNWTMTYRLDSDIHLRYLTVKDIHGRIVAPKKKPNWLKGGSVIDKKIMDEIKTKRKAAVWFVSNCYAPVNIELYEYIKDLQKELRKYSLHVDVFGKCGKSRCNRFVYYKNRRCDVILKQDYFFYLAFENAKVKDYITEKVFYAFTNRVVPIVFGGADYNSFLPPDSYIDASNISPEDLAALMSSIIQNKIIYARYFWWLPYYRIYEGTSDDFAEVTCELCAMLHDEAKVKRHSSYEDFRNWWSPNYKRDCTRRIF